MNRWAAIDDILERALRPTPRQKNLKCARERLVPLLERYGYHEPPPSTYTQEFSFVTGQWSFGWEQPASPCKNCDEEKPYRLYIGGDDYLEINHGVLCTDYSHEHQETFLKAMIPVIGKLDAVCHYIPYDGGNGPWLRIYL